jgi:hypothetical protein
VSDGCSDGPLHEAAAIAIAGTRPAVSLFDIMMDHSLRPCWAVFDEAPLPNDHAP